MLARHYDSMGRTTSMYTDSVGPTRRPRVHRQPNQPTPVNHQDPCTTRPPTQRHPGVHHFGSALPTQRAENGASRLVTPLDQGEPLLEKLIQYGSVPARSRLP